jgi:hypothetical protein
MEIVATIVEQTQVGARKRIMAGCEPQKSRLPLGETSGPGNQLRFSNACGW